MNLDLEYIHAVGPSDPLLDAGFRGEVVQEAQAAQDRVEAYVKQDEAQKKQKAQEVLAAEQAEIIESELASSVEPPSSKGVLTPGWFANRLNR